jgi:hypothetical protein
MGKGAFPAAWTYRPRADFRKSENQKVAKSVSMPTPVSSPLIAHARISHGAVRAHARRRRVTGAFHDERLLAIAPQLW